MKKFRLFIISLATACMLSSIASADLSDGFDLEPDRYRLLKFIIETDMHRIGDPPGEGITWEKSFRLPRRIGFTKTAFVTFSEAHLEMVNLVINGNTVAIPYFDPAHTDFPPDPDDFVNRVIAVPAAAFYKGENTIGFESLSWPDGNHDDFWFKNLVVYFQ